MTAPHLNFPRQMQLDALARQKYKCASCGAQIKMSGRAGARDHQFGEGAEGHHVVPHKMQGPITTENCVVLCRSCHLNAHQGGRWRDTSIYADIQRLPMAQRIERIAKEYRHYTG